MPCLHGPAPPAAHARALHEGRRAARSGAHAPRPPPHPPLKRQRCYLWPLAWETAGRNLRFSAAHAQLLVRAPARAAGPARMRPTCRRARPPRPLSPLPPRHTPQQLSLPMIVDVQLAHIHPVSGAFCAPMDLMVVPIHALEGGGLTVHCGALLQRVVDAAQGCTPVVAVAHSVMTIGLLAREDKVRAPT